MKHSDIAHFRQLTHLRRRFTARSRRFPPVLEPAAMVDVVLLVLLFFMTVSPMVTRPGVRLTLPVGEGLQALSMRAAVVTLTQKNQLFFNDRRSSVEELPEVLRRLHVEQPELPLVIEADAQVTLERQMQVYQAAAAAGFTDISIAARPSVSGELR